MTTQAERVVFDHRDDESNINSDDERDIDQQSVTITKTLKST